MLWRPVRAERPISYAQPLKLCIAVGRDKLPWIYTSASLSCDMKQWNHQAHLPQVAPVAGPNVLYDTGLEIGMQIAQSHVVCNAAMLKCECECADAVDLSLIVAQALYDLSDLPRKKFFANITISKPYHLFTESEKLNEEIGIKFQLVKKGRSASCGSSISKTKD